MRPSDAVVCLICASLLALGCGSGSGRPGNGADGSAEDGAAEVGADRSAPPDAHGGKDGAMGRKDGAADASADAAMGATDAAGGPDVHFDGGKGDAMGEGGAVTCAGKPCFAGQSCVGGACTFTDCTGDHVPGDYATVAAAVSALSGKGGTICLGAQAYDETVGVGTATAPGTLVIQGVSPAQTTLTQLSVESGSAIPTVVVKGLSLGSLFMFTGTAPVANDVSLSACKVGGISVSAGSGDVTLSLDGVEVTATSTVAPILSFGTADDGVNARLSIQNSYIHDSGGIRVSANFAWGVGLLLTTTMTNNTFVNNTTAVDDSSDPCCGWAISHAYSNNLFVDNGVGLSLATLGTVGNNAFYGNTTNYAGAAVDGPGTVKSDPMLDKSTAPPGLLSGSPCRGAGDASVAPTHDYWGRPRGSSVDIGAVQSSP